MDDPAYDSDAALTQVDPRYATILRIGTGLTFIPFLVGAWIATALLEWPVWWLVAPVLVVAVLFTALLPWRRWRARGYAMTPDRLRVVKGVMFHSDSTVPFGRVQHIDVDSGPVERAFGLATLTVHTAGSHNASVALPGLAQEDAHAMRETIRRAIGREEA